MSLSRYPAGNLDALARLDKTAANSIQDICKRLMGLGVTGRFAANRLEASGKDLAQFTTVSLRQYVDPTGASRAIERELMRSSRRLATIRNYLVLAPLLFTWFGVWWAATQYHAELAAHPEVASTPFLDLWQTGFGTGNAMLSFGGFTLLDSLLVAVVIGVGGIAGYLAQQAQRRAYVAYRLLEDALNVLGGVIKENGDIRNPVWSEETVEAAVTKLGKVVEETQTELVVMTTQAQEMLSAITARIATAAEHFAMSTNDLKTSLQGNNAFLSQFLSSLASAQSQASNINASVSGLERAQQGSNNELHRMVNEVQSTTRELRRSVEAIASMARMYEQSQRNAERVQLELVRSMERIQEQLIDQNQLASPRANSGFWPFGRRGRRASRETPYPMPQPPVPQEVPTGPIPTGQSQPTPIRSGQSEAASPSSSPAQEGALGPEQHADDDSQPGEAQLIQDPRFTVFCPREVEVEQWKTLLVYASTKAALDAIRADALRFEPELGQRPRQTFATTESAVLVGQEISFEPFCEGVSFNPRKRTFNWYEEWHRQEFAFKVDGDRAGEAGNGEITVYADQVIIAVVKFSMLFNEAGASAQGAALSEASGSVGIDGGIFPSYSHQDKKVALMVRNVVKTLGIPFNIDFDALRSGEDFDPALMRLIEQSPVFQLFWSERAARSPYVEREWRHALRQNRGPRHIRPFYWEEPCAPIPAELSHIHFTPVDMDDF